MVATPFGSGTLTATMMIFYGLLIFSSKLENASGLPWDKWLGIEKITVQVINDLRSRKKMTFQCSSEAGDYIGQHTLGFGKSFHFSFRNNLLETTRFSCNFEWDNKEPSTWLCQPLYYATRDRQLCAQDCKLKINEDGMHMYVHEAKNWQRIAGWCPYLPIIPNH